MHNQVINSLKDLNLLRSAPDLNTHQQEKLLIELSQAISNSDWFTIGIMAKSEAIAISTLREMENNLNWTKMKVVTNPKEDGPVYLKANQRTGDIHIRIESGLGEGILLGCHYYDDEKNVEVIGPLPLTFFKSKN